MGKRDTMEAIIHQEAQYLVESLRDRAGKKIDAKGFCQGATNNVIWRLVTGRRTRQDDPELKDLTDRITQAFRHFDPSSAFAVLQMNSLPLTKVLSALGQPNYIDGAKKLTDKLWETVLGSEADAEGNYVERALYEMEKEEEKERLCFNAKDGRFYLRAQLQDLFVAGTDTSATLIEWCLLYLMLHPEEQERLFSEVSLLTDGGRRPVGLSDRGEAHRVNAFVDEVIRHCPMASLPPAHKTTEDVHFRGSRIPKNTQVIPFAFAINHDEREFPSPYDFDPSRFLDLEGKYRRDENLFFFGVGKRRCPGETLGSAEVFLFLTSIIQEFKIRPVSPKAELSTVGLSGLVFYPRQFQFVPERRRQS